MSDEVEVQDQQAESVPQSGIETEQAAASAATETSETQTDQSTGDGQPPKKEGGVQRRIDELTKARRLAELDAEFWKTKALGGTEEAKPVPEAAASQPKPKPRPEDFDSNEAFWDARDEWVRDDTLRITREEQTKARQEEEKRTQAEIEVEEWSEREKPFLEKTPDYVEVSRAAMDTLAELKGPAVAGIAHALQKSDMGPQLLYYFGQHPEEAKSLSNMDPTVAVMALGEIKARLAQENPGGEVPPATTGAPKPPTPVKKTTTVAQPFNPTDPATYGGDFRTYKQKMDELAAKKK